MVEFGLKLEDNKVADWADKYIDYDKLKEILRLAKNAMKKRDEIMMRKPDLAAAIETAFKEGPSLAFFSPQPSFSSLTNLDVISESPEVDEASNREGDQAISSRRDESAALIDRSRQMYGSEASLLSVDTDSFSNKLYSKVTGIFSKTRYETSVRARLQEVEICHVQFETELFKELDSVNAFYDENCLLLNERLNLLIENVKASSVLHTFHDSSRSVVMTPTVSRRKSAADFIVTTIQSNFARKKKEEKHVIYDAPDEDLEEDQKESDERIRESDSVQRALVDQYRTNKLLHNFSIMNYTGFIKIIKKHDKTFPQYKGNYKDVVNNSSVCNNGNELVVLEQKMETLYADWFCGGDLREARAQMLPKRGDGLEMDWSQLRLGYRLGMCAILAMWVCWDCVWGLVKDGNTTIGGRTAFPVFRGCGGLALLHWLWGVSVYVWSRQRINYIYLFDFNPRIVDSAVTIFNDAVDETLVFLTCMLLYYKAGAHDIPNWIPAGYFAGFLVMYTMYKMIFPLRTRGPMWHAIFQVLIAPFTSPTFLTIYMADVFTSMVKVFQDIAWSFGFVVSGDFLVSEDKHRSTSHPWSHSFWYKNVLIPLICLFPLWIRFNQCLRRYIDTGKRMPNLANALKYAMSQTVTLFGAFHPLYMLHNRNQDAVFNYFQLFWIILFISSSLYSFWWDVVMDWGLGQREYQFLGPRLMFPARSTYYAVMAVDLVLRFLWVLTLIPPQSGASFELPQYLTAVSMGLELTRRTIWGFFRLENEHRSNTGQYRRVQFVPLHFTTGHTHNYTREKEHKGSQVLLEVVFITILVIGVSVTSVVAAQRASQRVSHINLSEL